MRPRIEQFWNFVFGDEVHTRLSVMSKSFNGLFFVANGIPCLQATFSYDLMQILAISPRLTASISKRSVAQKYYSPQIFTDAKVIYPQIFEDFIGAGQNFICC